MSNFKISRLSEPQHANANIFTQIENIIDGKEYENLEVANDLTVGNELILTNNLVAPPITYSLTDTTPVSVKMFGAVGDNIADDTAAIQAAINASRTVYFPAGAYKLTSTLTIPWDFFVTFYGESSSNTTLFHSGDYGDTIVASEIGFLTFRDIRLFVDNTVTIPTSGVHLWLDRCGVVFIDNICLEEMYSNLRITGGAGIYINNIFMAAGQFYGAPYPGYMMLLEAAAIGAIRAPNEIYMSNFNCKSNTPFMQYGFIIRACDGVQFSNGHVGFTPESCVWINPVDNTVSIVSVMFSNVYFDGSLNSTYGVLYSDSTPGGTTKELKTHTYNGCQFGISGTGMMVDVPTAVGIVVSGCLFFSNTGYGCRLLQGSNHIVTGCHFSENGDVVSLTQMEIACDSCIVDCSFSGTTRVFNGVVLNGAADNNWVRGSFNQTPNVDIVYNTTGQNNRIDIITDKSGTVASAAILPIIFGHDVFIVTGTTNISNGIAGQGFNGWKITLLFSGALTVSDAANLNLAGDFITTAGDTLTLIYANSVWNEVSRSTN